MKRKCLAVGIILLSVATVIIPSTAQNIEKTSLPTSRGNWLYVGGSGPGNYTRIQDAIDNASTGDTVFVFDDSSPYHENIWVNKSIYLYGEDSNTTTILGYVLVGADFVTVSNFTIQRFMDVSRYSPQNVTISQNIINDELSIDTCRNVTISSNALHGVGGSYASPFLIINCQRVIFMGNTIAPLSEYPPDCLGIILSTNDCIVSGNTFMNCTNKVGLFINDCSEMSVIDNHFISIAYCGLDIQFSSHIEIRRNNFIKTGGIFLYQCRWAKVVENNLIDSTSNSTWWLGFGNVWDKNYWGCPRLLPKPIYGIFHHYIWENYGLLIPALVKIDWHPAQEPFDIGS